MLKTNLLFVFLTFIIASEYIILGSRIPQERIMDGDVAKIEEFPFIVSLTITLNNTHISRCGGSLIGPTTILTAAHCVVDTYGFPLPSQNFKIRVGSDSNTDGGIVTFAKHHVKHPKYLKNSGDYDIAIIELDTGVIGHQGLKTAIIEMWDENVQFESNTPCWVAGWGKHTLNDLIDANQLEKKEIFLIDSPHICSNERKICASYGWGSEGISSGDSGGPLIINRKLAGISSSNSRILYEKSDVFTSVPAFRNWIRENSGI